MPPSKEIGGNWALFRLLDGAQVQRETEHLYALTLQEGGYTARLRLEADSNRNPFSRRDMLAQFRCGA